MAKANNPKLVGRHQKLVGYDNRLESNEGGARICYLGWGRGPWVTEMAFPAL